MIAKRDGTSNQRQIAKSADEDSSRTLAKRNEAAEPSKVAQLVLERIEALPETYYHRVAGHTAAVAMELGLFPSTSKMTVYDMAKVALRLPKKHADWLFSGDRSKGQVKEALNLIISDPLVRYSSLLSIERRTVSSSTKTSTVVLATKTRTVSRSTKTSTVSRVTKTRTVSRVAKSRPLSRSSKTRPPSRSVKTRPPSRSVKTRPPSRSAKTRPPSRSAKTRTVVSREPKRRPDTRESKSRIVISRSIERRPNTRAPTSRPPSRSIKRRTGTDIVLKSD